MAKTKKKTKKEHFTHIPHGPVEWFVIIILVLLVAFAVAFYVVRENRMLADDIGRPYVTDHGRVANKAIKNLGQEVMALKRSLLDKDKLSYKPLDAGLDYNVDYPFGWHVTADTEGDEVTLSLYPGPVMRRGGEVTSTAAIQIIDEDLGNTSFEDYISEKMGTLVNAVRESKSNKSGLEFVKIIGERTATDRFDAPEFFYLLPYINSEGESRVLMIYAVPQVQVDDKMQVDPRHGDVLLQIIESMSVPEYQPPAEEESAEEGEESADNEVTTDAIAEE